ncbi:MAG: IclR family transcriptional regulator [Paracoccaceae bacterium]
MGTVSKALELLDCFTRQRALIGLSDFARLSGMNKSTCHRMLTELAAFGFVEQVGKAREYRLGPQVLRMAALREAAVPMRDAAMPVLRGLAQSLGETVHLSVIVGENLQMLAFSYSTAHSMAVMMEDANTLPYHATASGLAVLGFGTPAFRERVLTQPLPRLTKRTETNPAVIRERAAQARARGFATSSGGFEAEVDSIAVPLFDAAGQCCGALAVAAPASRLTSELLAAIRHEITKGAAQIVALWGGQVPPDVTSIWQSALKSADLPLSERV